MAVQLYSMIYDLTLNKKSENLVENDVINEFRLFGLIAHLLFSIFVKPNIDLISQLVNLAYLSYLFLYLFGRNKTGHGINDHTLVISQSCPGIGHFTIRVTGTEDLL